ncbi:MAG: hypothetical protein RSF35_06280 [Akkermansia sp.]
MSGFEYAELAVEANRTNKVIKDVDGVFTLVDGPVYAPKWDESRRVAYGDVGAQLDMIYHDMVDGTTTFVDHVAVVKAAFPKSVV